MNYEVMIIHIITSQYGPASSNNLYNTVNTCSKPSISHGSVSPSDATVDYEATYEVTCDVGFTISGSTTMTCGADGNFDQDPTCQGKLSVEI